MDKDLMSVVRSGVCFGPEISLVGNLPYFPANNTIDYISATAKRQEYVSVPHVMEVGLPLGFFARFAIAFLIRSPDSS
ncbi:MAG TPA: hypothetical protein ACFYEF_13985 [Candidatus Wunengus sp. YC63]|uniref:hypothetical protein n=1 Tax=Candidatus Wunengus sp. YC63 TaxID=3367699 RepID=UPI004026A4C5